jgi:hypothetical protein
LHAVEGTGVAFFGGLALASAALFVAGIVVGQGLERLPARGRRFARGVVAAGFAVCSVGIAALSF